MICLDNSEYMRNSDFSPSRFEAQEDACNLISGKKTRDNVENVVGLMTTAGRNGCEVLVSLSQDPGKLLTAMHKIKLGGEADLVTSIQIARLALRNRQNKMQEQRIVLFVGSPVRATEKELSQLGGQLKKNKVAIDIVSFGEDNAEANQEKLAALHKAANNNDNCHIVTIPPGTHLLSEQLQRTPIVRGDAPDTGNNDNPFGVDDNIDPELAEALRLSMLQAEADNRNRAQTDGDGAAQPNAGGNQNNPNLMGLGLDEDPELAEALRLSMMAMETENTGSSSGNDASASSGAASNANADELMNVEDDDLAMAIRLSRETASQDRANDEKEKEKAKEPEKMQVEEKKEKKVGQTGKPEEPAVDMSAIDPEYMSSLFLELPGIDPNDPEVQALLKNMKNEAEKKEEKKD